MFEHFPNEDRTGLKSDHFMVDLNLPPLLDVSPRNARREQTRTSGGREAGGGLSGAGVPPVPQRTAGATVRSPRGPFPFSLTRAEPQLLRSAPRAAPGPSPRPRAPAPRPPPDRARREEEEKPPADGSPPPAPAPRRNFLPAEERENEGCLLSAPGSSAAFGGD